MGANRICNGHEGGGAACRYRQVGHTLLHSLCPSAEKERWSMLSPLDAP